ncbi:hypothetical protein V6N13_007699 [Hibiscus sabdariffa]
MMNDRDREISRTLMPLPSLSLIHHTRHCGLGEVQNKRGIRHMIHQRTEIPKPSIPPKINRPTITHNLYEVVTNTIPDKA